MSDLGLIGELEVIEYLEKNLKHSVYLPIKDRGIDFVSVSKSRFYQIQVKTSMFKKNRYFWFDLKKNRMIYSNNTFYIFVCKTLARRRFMGESFNYLVIPSLNLKNWIESGQIISQRGNPNKLNIFLYPDPENRRWIYKNKGKELDWTKYWNNFESLR